MQQSSHEAQFLVEGTHEALKYVLGKKPKIRHSLKCNGAHCLARYEICWTILLVNVFMSYLLVGFNPNTQAPQEGLEQLGYSSLQYVLYNSCSLSWYAKWLFLSGWTPIMLIILVDCIVSHSDKIFLISMCNYSNYSGICVFLFTQSCFGFVPRI